jgi:hypothetical protein
VDKLLEQNKDAVFNTKFNFINFYLEPKFEKFYDTLINNHVFFQAVLLYGINRNKYINLATSGEAFDILPLPQFYNFSFYNAYKNVSFVNDFFYELDKNVYSFNLPN